MNGFGRIFIWVSFIIIIDETESQVVTDKWNSTALRRLLQPSVFSLADGEKLILDEKYCLKSITVKVYLTNQTFEGENNPSMRLNITWESDQDMTSISVETASLDDSYCEAKDRFSYHRKPIEKNAHTFPDIVNYGSRFIPIKLDCTYLVIPEMGYPCLPLKLKYTTPVCLSESVCGCRNTSLPGPSLKVQLKPTGVEVRWEIGENSFGNVEEIKKVWVSVGVVQATIPYTREEIQPREYATGEWEKATVRSGRHFFELNTNYSRSYIVRGIYENVFECSSNITHVIFNFPEIHRGSNHILLYIVSCFLIIVVSILLLWHSCRRKLGRLLCNKLQLADRPGLNVDNNDNIFPPLSGQRTVVNNPIYSTNFPEKDLYLIDYKELVLKRKLAEGHFGVVYLGSWASDAKASKILAVKQLKDTASKVDIDDFMEEIKTFKTAGAHNHIVRMIGYCKPPQRLSIVMEYVPYNLLEYLKNLRDDYEMTGKSAGKCALRNSHESLPSNYITANEVEKMLLNEEKVELECVLDIQELESFGLQIARGMSHLEAKSIVHRDLAARNVLVDNNKTLKISDFGMSKTGIYVNKTTRQFPLRWMSPEAVTSGTFSNKSDVWSYGIVLWEIGTLGGFPYSEFQNDEVYKLIGKGGHPDQPESVTPILFDLMLSCWSYKPENRPNFSDIVKKIENWRQKAYVDFDDLRKYYEFPPTEEEVGGA